MQKFDIEKYFTLTKDLGFAKIYYSAELNIIKVLYSDHCIINLNEAKEIIKYSKETANLNTHLFALTVLGKKTIINEDARKVFGEDHFNQLQIKTTAIVINELAQRIIFKIYLKINKPKSEIIAFKSESLAFLWLSKKAKTSCKTLTN